MDDSQTLQAFDARWLSLVHGRASRRIARFTREHQVVRLADVAKALAPLRPFTLEDTRRALRAVAHGSRYKVGNLRYGWDLRLSRMQAAGQWPPEWWFELQLALPTWSRTWRLPDAAVERTGPQSHTWRLTDEAVNNWAPKLLSYIQKLDADYLPKYGIFRSQKPLRVRYELFDPAAVVDTSGWQVLLNTGWHALAVLEGRDDIAELIGRLERLPDRTPLLSKPELAATCEDGADMATIDQLLRAANLASGSTQ